MKKVLVILFFGLLTLGAQAQSLTPIGDGALNEVLLVESVNEDIYAVSYNVKDGEYRLHFFDLIEWTDLGALPSLPKDGKNPEGVFHLKDLQYFEGELFLCGSYDFEAGNQQKNVALKYDGQKWDDISNSLIQNSIQLTKYLIYNDQITLVGIYSSVQSINLLTYAKGNWSPLGDFGTYNLIEDQVKDAYIWKNKIYASGVFSKPGVTGKRYLMSFDGIKWSYNINPPFLHKNSYFAIHKNHLVLTGTPNAPTVSDYDYFKKYNGVGSSWEDYSEGLKGIVIDNVKCLQSDGKVLWATGTFFIKDTKDTFYLLYNKDDVWHRAQTAFRAPQSLSYWNKQAVVHGDYTLNGISSIATLGEGFAYVRGSVFNDIDGNCLRGATEGGTRPHELILNPGGHKIFTSTDGHFNFHVLKGNYTLELVEGPFWKSSCNGNKVHFTATENINLSQINYGMQKVPGKVDVTAHLHDFKSKKVKAGSKEHFVLEVRNRGTADVGAFSVQIRIHPKGANATFNIPPTSYIDGVATWDIASLAEGEIKYFKIDIDIPNGGENFSVAYELLLPGDFNDIESGNDRDSVSYGRYSENKNLLKTSDQPETLPKNTTELGYNIFLRNTTGATLNKMIVVDTLDEDVDLLGVVRYTYPKHQNQTIDVQILPSGKWQYTLKWLFTNANLADSSANPSQSLAHIAYHLKIPENSLEQHAVVCNEAQLFIENFEPLVTNEVCSQMTGSVPQLQYDKLRIFPNPSTGLITVDNVLDHEKVLTVMSMDGRIQQTLDAPAFKKTTFDLNGLSKGVYFISTDGYRAYKLILH
jgi:hypothetical protein